MHICYFWTIFILLHAAVWNSDGFLTKYSGSLKYTTNCRCGPDESSLWSYDKRKSTAIVAIACHIISMMWGAFPAIADDMNLQSELEEMVERTEFENYKKAKEPKGMVKGIRARLGEKLQQMKAVDPKDIDRAVEKVLTLKAYLDEAERDLFSKNWDNLQVYLYTFAEQEDAFALLIDQLFPTKDALDRSARAALSFEAQSMFVHLDDLREAAREERMEVAQDAYAKLLLSYDRFLKAGNLYPTYDAITSTEVFFLDTPKIDLNFDLKAKVQVLDEIVLTSGPDMGKTGMVINVDGENAVIKLDKDGKAYQEVKYVKYNTLAKVKQDKVDEKKSKARK